MNQNIKSIIETFRPISLAKMDAVSLMKRTDTKFIVPAELLPDILLAIRDDYQVLTINKNRIMTYASEYFDTENCTFYNDHHNGKASRIKVRIRNYVESGLYFLEVKLKNGKGVTNKKRIALNSFEKDLSETSRAFIEKVTRKQFDLHATIINSFQRVTLVNTLDQERVTIDMSLSYVKNDQTKDMGNLIVIELKQEKFDRNSSIVKCLNTLRIKPFSISKYCIGMLSIDPSLKHNAFKQKLRTVKKLLAA